MSSKAFEKEDELPHSAIKTRYALTAVHLMDGFHYAERVKFVSSGGLVINIPQHYDLSALVLLDPVACFPPSHG